MSRIYVDRISPYQSGSVQVDGLNIDTGSLTTTASFNAYTASNDNVIATLATTGSNQFNGNQVVTGSLSQNFAAPATNNENSFVNVGGAQVNGKSYNRVFNGFANYPSFGIGYQNYFTIEYYDSTGYNFGSEFSINGKQAQLSSQASGSAQISTVRTEDNYDGTSQITLTSPNKIQLTGPTTITGNPTINGVTQFNGFLTIAELPGLPSGSVGQLAVSGSNLYYHDGSNWTQIN
jgi:hypothetical protein